MRTEVLKNPEPVVPRLRRITDNGETEETALESLPFTIGRSSDCDLCIESPKVSRKHAAIESLGNRFQIRDLGSTNGTLVNGQRAEKADLNDGDIVVIADLEFSFLAAAGADRLDTVTMAIDARRGSESSDDTPRQLIQDIRRIHEIAEENPELLQYLETNGIVPGVQIEIGEVLAFNETMNLIVGERNITLGFAAARSIFVEKLPC